LLSPTPGSTGTAEHFFMESFSGYLGQYTIGAAMLWRIVTYYPYLIVGAIILPKLVKRVFFTHHKQKEA